MDLSFIGDQLGNFADFASGIKNLFKGFAGVFDAIANATQPGYEVKPELDSTDKLTGLNALSSK
ncbi:hypothetical protein FKE98_10630 [Corynebacterium aurimucosum]|uniref:PorH family porin n=1 Tax=Corynebacterium TaxID=1716 RepID=UPI0012B9E1AE|nr:PorH family porin [Corynebacterium guaraldiae]MTE10825.1 hypothetical protein [Corynebacterium guaraldiae]